MVKTSVTGNLNAIILTGEPPLGAPADPGTVLYSRCNFTNGDGGTIHCVDLVYPQEVARAWDRIVTRISRSLRPLEG